MIFNNMKNNHILTILSYAAIIFLFNCVLVYAEKTDYTVYSARHLYFRDYFSELDEDSKVRCIFTIPWRPDPEDVVNIIFLTAGQQAIGDSTESNITGGHKGQQEIFYNTERNSLNSLVQTLINADKFDWFVNGTTQTEKEVIRLAVGGAAGGAIGLIFGGLGGAIVGGIVGGLIGAATLPDVEFLLEQNREYYLSFFHENSLAEDIMTLDNVIMPDGTILNQENTLVFLNIRGLCVKEKESTRKKLVETYCNMLKDLSGDFKNTRLIYLAGHSRGAVQTLRMGEHIRVNNMVNPKKTRVLVTSVDAVAEPGEVHSSSDDWVLNPFEMNDTSSGGSIPEHDKTYFGYYVDLQEYLGTSIPTNELEDFNYDGSFYVNNLASGSLLMENYYEGLEKVGLGELVEKLTGEITGQIDKSALCMDYDRTYVQDYRRYNLLGCFSQNWIYEDHPDLCSVYGKAHVADQYEFFKTMGFFPSYNIEVEVKVDKDTPLQPVISWNMADEEIWNKVRNDQVITYNVYRKITEDVLTEPLYVRDDWTLVKSGLTASPYTDDLEDEDFPEEEDLSAGKNIYYKIACVITSDNIHDPVNSEPPEVNPAIEVGTSISNSHWAAIANRQKYEYTSESTGTSRPYLYRGPAELDDDEYYYSEPVPRSKKSIFIPQFEYQIPLKIDDELYDSLSEVIQGYYTYNTDDEEWVLQSDKTFREKLEIRDYLHENKIEYHDYTCNDIFNNAFTYEFFTEEDEPGSLDTFAYYHEEKTNKKVVEPLKEVRANSAIFILPVNIYNYADDTEIEFSINGGDYITGIPLESITGDDDLLTYAENKLASGIYGSSFVYDSRGNGFIFSKNYKDGYNTIYFTFNDPYQNRFELVVFQQSLPPFIMPIYPLQDQYINTTNPEITIGAVYLNQYIIDVVGIDWFDQAIISIKLDGNDVNNFNKNDDDKIITFQPENLSSGNHRLEINVKVGTIENESGWRFWVDTEPPVVTFPQYMILSNISKIRTGNLLAYITDEIPYMSYTGELLTTYNTTYLESLEMKIVDSSENDVMTFLELENCRLGVVGGLWNGWKQENDISTEQLPHGIYYLDVTATDRAGNITPAMAGGNPNRAIVHIDSQGPALTGTLINYLTINSQIVINHNIASSINAPPSIEVTIDLDEWEEDTSLIIVYKNIDTDEYIRRKAGQFPAGTHTIILEDLIDGAYGIKDGVYDVFVSGEDELGNMTELDVSRILLDRTAPVIENTAILPPTVTGSEDITLSFQTINSEDVEIFQNDTISAEISVGNTGQVLFQGDNIGNGSSLITFSQDQSPPAGVEPGEGSIKFSVSDSRGNTAQDIALFIMEYLPPEISVVEPSFQGIIDGDGSILIKGNVRDPHFNNGKDFVRYGLFYTYFEQGSEPPVPADLSTVEETWESVGMAVPGYQQNSEWPDNYGRYTVSGIELLGVIDGTLLSDGYYKLLLVVEEQEEIRTAGSYIIYVSHDSLASTEISVEFNSPPSSREFTDDDDSLSLDYTVTHEYTNPVDLYGYIKHKESGDIIKTYTFNNYVSNACNGEPVINTLDKGFFLYKKTDDRYYLECKNNNESARDFKAVLETEGGFQDITTSSSGGFTPDYFSGTSPNLTLSTSLEPSQSFTISFVIPENTSFDIVCLMDSLAGPLYLGTTRQQVEFVHSLIVSPGEQDQESIISGEPILQPEDKGFFFYKENTQGYTCIAHNSLEEEAAFSLALTTKSEFVAITFNGEAWTNPDPSADNNFISTIQILQPGDSYTLSFELADNSDFTLFCDSGEELGPLYLGNNKIPHVLKYDATISGHDDTTSMVWNGKDYFDKWAADGDYLFVVEATGRNGGYAAAETEILISTPFKLTFISLTNPEIKPLVEEVCQVTMKSEKPCSIEVAAIDDDDNIIKNVTPNPIILEKGGIFSFTWNGTDNDNNILPDDPDKFYTFVVTATSTYGGNSVTYTVEQKVTVNSSIILDDSITAALDFPASDSVIKGDSSYKVEIEPSGSYYPDINAQVTLEAVSGTQAVIAAPYLDYLAGIRCIYRDVVADVSLTADLYVNGTKKDTLTIFEDEYVVATYSIYDGLDKPSYSEVDNLTYYVIGYDQKPSIEFRNLTVTVNKGTDYAGSSEISFSRQGLTVTEEEPGSGSWIVETTFNATIKANNSFDETDYLRIADTLWTAGPDITTENQNAYKHHMGYAEIWSLETNFTVNVKRKSEFNDEYLLKEPRFYLYSLAEDYPDLDQVQEDFEYGHFLDPGAQTGEKINLSAFTSAQIDPINLRINTENVSNNDVSFSIHGYANISDGDMWVETIKVEALTTARTKLTCAYPYSRALYDAGELYYNDVLIARINEDRDDSNPIPSYNIIPFLTYDGIGICPNLFFEDGSFENYKPYEFEDWVVIPKMTRSGTLSYDLHGDDQYAPGYTGEIDVNFGGNLPYVWQQNLSIETWEVTDASFTGDISVTGYENLVGREFTLDGTEGNTYGIRIPEDNVYIYTGESPWNLGDDNYYTPQLSIVSADQDILENNAEGLHKTGKSSKQYIADFYMPGPDLSDDYPIAAPAFWNRSMLKYLSSEWMDNESVLINPDLGGKYDVSLKGIDGTDFHGLTILNTDITYNGKGGKLLDSFYLSLTNDNVRRLVPVMGEWDTSPGTIVTLSYPDAFGTWCYILDEDDQPVDPENNIIAYWDVTGLNGMIPLKLTVQNGDGINIAINNVYIGETINTDSSINHISTAKGEATLTIPQGSLDEEEILSIDVVKMDDIKDFAYFADIPGPGKVISLQPDGLEFDNGKTASLQFIYHWTEVGDIDLQNFIIFKLKPDGELLKLNTIHRYFRNDKDDPVYEYDTNDPDSFNLPGTWDYVKVLAELTGFSYYSNLETQFIGGPHLDPVDELTNQQQITITGNGEPGQLMIVYVLNTPHFDPEEATPAVVPLVYSDDEGNFEIPGIPLPFEGKNYIFVGYNINSGSKWSKCIVVKDTIPPVLTVVPYNPVISPNGDTIRDTLPLYITANEDCVFDVMLQDSSQNTIGQLGSGNSYANTQTTFVVDGTDGAGNTLADGTYYIQLVPEDTIGNRGPGSLYILIIDNAGTYNGQDIIPPQTDIIIGDPQYLATDNTLFITSQTPINLQAVDNIGGSGISRINYRINNGTWEHINAAEHLFTISGPDGPYTIEYYSLDLWGNPEPAKSITLSLDNSAPVTEIIPGLPHFLNSGGNQFVTSQTPVIISADDSANGSGVALIKYMINFGSWFTLDSTGSSFTIEGPDGMYDIDYYSIDELGNQESIQRTHLYLDNTPPGTDLTPGYPQYLSPDDKLFITSETLLELDADDNDGSGVDVINYRINGGTWQTVGGSDCFFTITGADGMYVVDYYSIDNLGNDESIKSMVFYLDNTPPETEVTIGTPQYMAPDDKLFITSNTVISLHAEDNPGGSGVEFLNYRINDGTWMTITGQDTSFTIIGEDGEYTITYYSSDNCDNTEEVKSIVLYLDNTPPVIDMRIELKGTPRYVYLPDDTEEIELTDNEKLVAEVEDAKEKLVGSTILPLIYSGLASAKFRIANGAWQDLTPDNLDAALIGEDEVLTEIEGVDNVENTTLKSYIISHYAIFSVPGAVISTTYDISILNSGMTIDSYDSDTGMQHTNDGDVIAKGKILVNSTPDINGDLYDYTDAGIEQVPVPADARVIDNFIVNSGETKVIDHGTYYIKNLIVNSNARLIIRGGWVKIWFDWCTVDGKIEVDIVKHLWMLGTNTTQHMNINGSTDFKGIMFVPKGHINVNGKVDGSVIGTSVTVNSGAYIYYDQDTLIHDRWSTIGDAAAP